MRAAISDDCVGEPPGELIDSATASGLPFVKAFSISAVRDWSDSVPRVLDNLDWWRSFKDPTLDRLVEQALSGSLSLDLARERVIEARAARDTLPQAANL